MSKQIEQIVMSIAQPIAQDMGVYVVDIEFKKESKDWFLRIYIDKDGGVSIDDCEQLSRRFSDEIDKTDPIEQNYCLEVSSPGADRKLQKEREFLYYLGRNVDVKLYQAIDGNKKFSGVLKSFSDKTAVIDCGGKLMEVAQNQAVYIRLAFTF